MIRINIEDVKAALQERARINRTPLDDIEWYEQGKRVEIPQEWIDEFELTGLLNIDFISSNYYHFGPGENQYSASAPDVAQPEPRADTEQE